MKANDVLTLANKATKLRRTINGSYMLMCEAKRVGDTKAFEEYQIDFCRYKADFCSIIECIAVVSKEAGDEYRMYGFGRNDF